MIRFASFSLLLMAATRAAARASGLADESHTRFDLSGPLAQSGYLTPHLTGTTRVPKERARDKAEVKPMVLTIRERPIEIV